MKRRWPITLSLIIHAALCGLAGAAHTLTVRCINGWVDVAVCDPNDPSVWLAPDDPNALTFGLNEEIRLIPRPDAGYSFRSWSGDDVPNGWRKRQVLYVTMDGDKSIVANFDMWKPPIGVPEPPFGVFETYRMYDDPSVRNPGLTYHQNAEGGYYTHYIDSGDPNATDTDNPYGTIDKPRRTIPYSGLDSEHHYIVPLSPGTVMEVRGKHDMLEIRPNGWLHGYLFTDGGTSDRPAFVRGDPNDPAVIITRTADTYANTISGDYIVLEHLEFNNSLVAMSGASHSVIRNCEIHNIARVNGRAVSLGSVTDCVFYGNHIHHNWGTWDSSSKDMHNIAVTGASERLWVIDNHIHHASYRSDGTTARTGGDAIQVMGSGCTDVNNLGNWPSHIYIARNVMHHSTENSVDIKCSNHVVVSQNEAMWDGFLPYTSASMVNHENAHNTWFIFNVVHDVRVGIRPEDAKGDAWVIGNVIYNIQYPVTGGTIYGNFVGGVWARIVQTHIVGNTFYNVMGGALVPTNRGSCTIINNIVSCVPVPYPDNLSWYHAGVEGGGDASDRALLDYCLFHQPIGVERYVPEGVIKLRWGNGVYEGLERFQASVGQGLNCIEADPLFDDAANYAFGLDSASAAIDSGTSEGIIQDIMETYYDTFGVSIACDIEGRPRPQGRGWDIGAYEYFISPIGDLAGSGVSRNSVTVAWTVPGEEGFTGVPASYDIRYAQGPITEANWDSADQVQGEPVAGDLGQQQSFTITGLDPGTTYYVAVKVLDEVGHFSDLSNVISATTATSGNCAPVMQAIGNRSVPAGEGLAFTVSATDADGDALTYSATNVPAGASFNPATRAFAWTPAGGQSGTHHVLFSVTDGQVTVSETIAITVNNHAPVLDSIGNKTVAENALLSFSVSAADQDGDSLTYSATGLPTGATFANRTFTWTPTNIQSGAYQVTFAVSDGLATVSETITITVTQGLNRAPVLAAIGNRSAAANTLLTFSLSATDPDGDALTYSATGLPTGASFAGQTFSWTPGYDQAGPHTVTFTVTDGELSDSEQVTITVASSGDSTPPAAGDFSPSADAFQAPRNSLVALAVSDAGLGVDANTVTIRVNDQLVYSGNSASYQSAFGVCRRTGTAASYRYTFQPADDFDFDESVSVRVTASDLAHNAMTPVEYQFRTEMRAFGDNHPVSWGPAGLDKGAPATACDSAGHIWVVFHAGPVGQRDIYLGKLAAGDGGFAVPVPLTDNAGDQCHPDIAIGTDDTLYVVWQDDRRGKWDVYAATSADGVAWSAQMRVSDSNDNQTAPAVAVDARSPNRAYVAWQDDRAGNADIYIAESANGFVTNTVTRVTSNSAAQTAPALAVDGSNTVYVVWTDRRSGSDDVYGAASNVGPWTNVPVATGAGRQSSPDIAGEAAGSLLHLIWVDDLLGHDEVRYACCDGMPAGPLTGTFIVDDTSDADQTAPSIVVKGSTGAGLKVFACWRDGRNLDVNGRDTDLYFVEIKTGDETNILVGDGGTRSNQNEPAVGVDAYGQPYVVWSDDRNLRSEIYHAGCTFADPVPLASRSIVALTGGTVGTTPAAGVGDVSVVVPAGACPQDVTITIAPVSNPQRPVVSSHVLTYEFGPSGLQFVSPVTITIPYAAADFAGSPPVPCWYDAVTGAFSQEGISNVRWLVLSASTNAVRFDTTHFTPYSLADIVADGDSIPGIDGSAGGGGCSLSPGHRGDLVSFVLPYLALAVVMTALRRRDRRTHRV
jgi:hypothetical protein